MPAKNPHLAAALDLLIEGSRLDAPCDFPATVATAGVALGARSVELWVQDYAHQLLLCLTSDEALPIDGSAAGQAFADSATVAVGDEGAVRLWVPLRAGSERLGLVGLVFEAVDPEVRRIANRFASVVAGLLVSRGMVTDVFARRRRTREMGLAAEMQWDLLPPLSFSTDRVAVAGILEPAYSVGGDAFDYSYDGLLRFAIFDAMGHGVQAAITSGLAVGAYRHARRRALCLAETYAWVDAAVAEHRPTGFVTAVFGEVDPSTSSLRWVDAGHPAPRLLRGGILAELPAVDPAVPCGLGTQAGTGAPAVAETTLVPGDLLVLSTDGAIEQRNADGSPFGEDRLIALLAKHVAEGCTLEESLRRAVGVLLGFAGSALRDDATVLLLAYDEPTAIPDA